MMASAHDGIRPSRHLDWMKARHEDVATVGLGTGTDEPRTATADSTTVGGTHSTAQQDYPWMSVTARTQMAGFLVRGMTAGIGIPLVSKTRLFFRHIPE